MDAPVGTHLQRLADRIHGLLGAHAQRRHLDVLGVLGLLLDLERLLDGVLVELGEQSVHAHTVDGLVVLEVPVTGGVRNVLHTDSDLHGRDGPPAFLATARATGCAARLPAALRGLELRQPCFPPRGVAGDSLRTWTWSCARPAVRRIRRSSACAATAGLPWLRTRPTPRRAPHPRPPSWRPACPHARSARPSRSFSPTSRTRP